VTPFLRIAAVAELKLAPHFVMEIHVHLACAYPHESRVEHIKWLEPAFEERLEIRDGRMVLPDRPGLGFTLSERGRAWRVGGGGGIRAKMVLAATRGGLMLGMEARFLLCPA
jgi:L-alanine-DL-glutamate epimerase-like enolase superfamily enzyme